MTTIALVLSARARSVAIIASAALALTACGPSGGQLAANPPSFAAPVKPVQAEPLAGEAQAVMGSGPVRVALILPLTQGAAPSVVGRSLRNAAEMALAESGGADLTVLVKDDRGTPDGARAAVEAAAAEGAELYIGPLFAADVREVGRAARSANRPVIAFSTDTSTAARGVYLLSFLVENYVDRIVDYAAARGKKSFAALVPENEYGNLALAAFQQATARKGVRVQSIERYQPGQAEASVQRIAALGDQIDALFIPEQAEAMAGLSRQLTAAGLVGRVQILGTGVWNDARATKLPALQGAWFATPENGGFNAFAQRYRTKFGSDPTRIATLAYDAVSLTAALARTQGAQRFNEQVLTNPSGFNGADGVFRFRPDGQNERGLSVQQIGEGSTTTLSPAPRSFTGVASAQ